MAKNKWSGLINQVDVDRAEDYPEEPILNDGELKVILGDDYVQEPEVLTTAEQSVCDLTSQEIKLLKSLEGGPRDYSFEFVDGLNKLVSLQLAVEVDGQYMRGSKWVETVRSLKTTLTTGCPTCN